MARRGGPEGHDAGEARLAEERQRGAHAAHGAEHALVEGVQPVRVGELLERAGARRPGRAHERVERAPAAADGREGGLHVRRDQQVRPQREDVGRALRPQPLLGVPEVGLAARQDRNTAALRGEQLGRRAAHAARAARHQRRRAPEPEVHGRRP